MAVVYYCPHCSQSIRTSDPLDLHIPLKTCAKCGKHYIDHLCSEPALRPYKPLPVWYHLLISCYNGVLLSLLATMLASIAVKDSSVRWLIFGVGIPVFSLLLFLRRMLSRKKIEELRMQTWQESDQRLRKTRYAVALKLYGYLVPAQYLPHRYWEKKDSLTFPGITVWDNFGTKRNQKPKKPSGPMDY